MSEQESSIPKCVFKDHCTDDPIKCKKCKYNSINKSSFYTPTAEKGLESWNDIIKEGMGSIKALERELIPSPIDTMIEAITNMKSLAQMPFEYELAKFKHKKCNNYDPMTLLFMTWMIMQRGKE